MAFNNYSNNKKDNSDFKDITLYSNYSMVNTESTVDKTSLRTRFWKSNLVVQISPMVNDGTDTFKSDKNSGATIYLSHSKARILHDEILLFLKDPTAYNTVGVDSNKAIITISNGSNYGVDVPVLTIYAKSEDTNEVIGSYAYEFRRDYHYAIRNYTGDASEAVKAMKDYNDLEILQFVTLLEEFYKASTRAVAFSVLDANSWSATRVENKINAIAKSLGVDISYGGNGRSYSNSSYFDNTPSDSDHGSSSYSSNSVGYGSATIDDLE